MAEDEEQIYKEYGYAYERLMQHLKLEAKRAESGLKLDKDRFNDGETIVD